MENPLFFVVSSDVIYMWRVCTTINVKSRSRVKKKERDLSFCVSWRRIFSNPVYTTSENEQRRRRSEKTAKQRSKTRASRNIFTLSDTRASIQPPQQAGPWRCTCGNFSQKCDTTLVGTGCPKGFHRQSFYIRKRPMYYTDWQQLTLQLP